VKTPSGELDEDGGIIAGKPRPTEASTDESISCNGTMSNESRMREICMSGLMRRGWPQGHSFTLPGWVDSNAPISERFSYFLYKKNRAF